MAKLVIDLLEGEPLLINKDYLESGDADALYLQVVNDLSDVSNVATARTNLGLVAGGAGDVWVEKAGDVMTGQLEIRSSNPVIRLRDTGTPAGGTNAFVEFGGTSGGNWSRTGWVGDGSSGDNAITLWAEVGNLKLGDSSSSSVLTLIGGNAIFSGAISLGFGDLVSEQNPDVVNAIRLKGTSSDVDIVLGDTTGYFSVWNVADNKAVFYVNNVGDTDIAGDLTVKNAIGANILSVNISQGRVSINTATSQAALNIGGDRIISIIGGAAIIQATSGPITIKSSASNPINLDSPNIRVQGYDNASAFNLRPNAATRKGITIREATGGSTAQTAALQVLNDAADEVLKFTFEGDFAVADTAGGSITNVLSLYHDVTNGSQAIGIGTGLTFKTDNDQNIQKPLGTLQMFTTEVAQELTAEFIINLHNNSATPTEVLRIDNDGNMGIGIAAPLAKLHINQAVTDDAIPVLYLDQADISEEMIEFNTTIGVGNAIEAIAAKSLTTTHFIKVTIPGGLTRYIPIGTIA